MESLSRVAERGFLVEKEGSVLSTEKDGVLEFSVPQRAKVRMLISKGDSKVKMYIGKNALLDLVLHANGKEDAAVHLDLFVEEGARLNLKELQDGSSKLSMNVNIICRENAIVTRQVANFSSGEVKTLFNCALEGEGADFSDLELHFGTKQANTENKLNVIHNVSNTKSVMRMKGAFKDSSRNYTHGTVVVKKDTANTNTFLSAHALLLDKNAHAVAIPALEIESADVQAGHSASVSTIDEEQLFYLMTRGLSFEEAKKEIVKAFLIDLVCEKELGDFIERQWQENSMLIA